MTETACRLGSLFIAESGLHCKVPFVFDKGTKLLRARSYPICGKCVKDEEWSLRGASGEFVDAED